jgi:hypothetical protein
LGTERATEMGSGQGEERQVTKDEASQLGTWAGTVRAIAAGTAIGAGLFGVAACSSGPSPGAVGTSCGETRTAAHVLVALKVTKGPVNCAAALRAEQGYSSMLSAGEVRGNGGGAPVTVDGWTCEGYSTPVAIQTGNASECHTATAEVVAVLVLPSTGS